MRKLPEKSYVAARGGQRFITPCMLITGHMERKTQFICPAAAHRSLSYAFSYREPSLKLGCEWGRSCWCCLSKDVWKGSIVVRQHHVHVYCPAFPSTNEPIGQFTTAKVPLSFWPIALSASSSSSTNFADHRMILMLVARDSIVRSLTCVRQVILGWSRCQHCMQLQLHEFGYMLFIHMYGVLPPRDFATTFAIEDCLLPPAL